MKLAIGSRRAMSWLRYAASTQPGSLTTAEVYSVTAFVLYLNGIVGEDHVLNQRTLPLVEMPNRHGFISDSRPDVRSRP